MRNLWCWGLVLISAVMLLSLWMFDLGGDLDVDVEDGHLDLEAGLLHLFDNLTELFEHS